MAEKDKKTDKAKKGSKEKVERVYTIPLLKNNQKVARWKRTKKAVRTIREFTEKHMKVEDVKIEKELNEKLWERGSKKAPPRIKVSIVKEGDKAKVQLFGFKFSESKEEKDKKGKKGKEKKEEKSQLEEELKEEKIVEKKKEDQDKIKPTQKSRMKNE